MNRLFTLLFLLLFAGLVWVNVTFHEARGARERDDMQRFRAVAPQLSAVLPPTARILLSGRAATTDRLVKLRHWMPPQLLFISPQDAADAILRLDFADSPVVDQTGCLLWSARDDVYTYRLALP